MLKVRIGEKVQIVKGTLSGQTGRLAFEGKVQFSSGIWVGVVLDKPVGKNDGMVKGVRYFQARPKFGAFLKPDAIKSRKTMKSGLPKPSGLAKPSGFAKPTAISKPSGIPKSGISKISRPTGIPRTGSFSSQRSRNSSRSRGASPSMTRKESRSSSKPISPADSKRRKHSMTSASSTFPRGEGAKSRSPGGPRSSVPAIRSSRPSGSITSVRTGVSRSSSGGHLSEISRLTANVEDLKSRLSMANAKINEKNAIIAQLSQDGGDGGAESIKLKETIRKLQKEIMNTQASESALKAENEQLRSEVQTANAVIKSQSGGDLSHELVDAKREIGILRANLEAVQAARRRDRSPPSGSDAVALQTNRIPSIDTELENKLRGQIGQLEETLMEYESKMEEDREAIMAHDEKIDRLSDKLNAKKEEVKSLQLEIESVKLAAKSRENEDGGATAALDDAKADLEALKKQMDHKLAAAKEANEAKIKRIKTKLLDQVQDIERQRDEKKRRLDVVTGNLEKINAMFNKAQNEAKKNTDRMKTLEKEVAKLKGEVELHELEKEELELNVEEKEEQLLELNQKYAQMATSNNKLKTQLSSVKNEIISAMPQDKKQSAELADKNKQLTEALVNLRDITTDKIDRLTASVKSLKEERDKLSKDVKNAQQLEEKLKDSTEQVVELQAELEEYGEMDTTVEVQSSKITDLEEECEKLKGMNKQLTELVQANEEMEESQAEIEAEYQEEIAQKEAELGAAKRRIKKLTASQKDSQRTVGQFRELVNALQEENKQLKTRVGAIANKSKLQVAKAHTALSRNLKLQTTASVARERTAAYHIASMQSNEAEQYCEFVMQYMPDTVQINKKVFNVMAMLERVRFSSMLIGAMVNEYYGLKSAVFELDMASLAYTACEATVDICEALAITYFKLHLADEMGVQSVMLRLSAIATVEKSVSLFLDIVTQDRLSVETPLDPLHKAAEDIHSFHQKYLGDVKIDESSEAVVLERTRLEALRIHYKHLKTCAIVKQVDDYIDVLKATAGDDDDDEGEEKEQPYMEGVNALTSSLDSLSAIQTTSGSLLFGLSVSHALPEGMRVDLNAKVGEAMDRMRDNVEMFHDMLEKAVSVDEEDQRGEPATPVEILSKVAALSKESVDDLNKDISLMHQELNAVSKGLNAPENKEKKHGLVYTNKFISFEANRVDKSSWLRDAEIMRKELAQTAGSQAELKTAKESLASHTKDLFQLRKELQAKITKNNVLTTQIGLLQDRAGNVEGLSVQIQDLESTLKDKVETVTRLKNENANLHSKVGAIRRRYEEEKLKNKRGFHESRESISHANMAPEEAQAEITLLRNTIAHVQNEFNEYKWKGTSGRLIRDLPPLPPFERAGESDPTSETSSIIRDLRILSDKVMNTRACPQLVDLSKSGASQRWLGHVSSMQKLSRKTRDLQLRLVKASESHSAAGWIKKVNPESKARMVGRITIPTLPGLKTGFSGGRVLVSSQQMAALCKPLTAW